MKAYIGLDIGGTKILGVLYNENKEALASVKKKTKATGGLEVVLEQIYKVVDGLLEDSEVELVGIGGGSPGIIIDESTIKFAPNIPFNGLNLGKIMEEKYGVPFILGNDVNVAMYGEWKASSISEAKSILGVYVGTGLGGAIIIDGKMYTGLGGAAEFGHMNVNPDGVICGCGSKGCLESYASKTGMQKAINAAIRKGRETVLEDYLKSDGDVIKSSSLQKAYVAGDHVAIEVIDDGMDYLARGMATLVNLFHPELIILGGGVMESMGALLKDRIVEKTKGYAMIGLADEVRFELSHLSDDAGVYGAFQLIYDKLN